MESPSDIGGHNVSSMEHCGDMRSVSEQYSSRHTSEAEKFQMVDNMPGLVGLLRPLPFFVKG